MARRPLDTPGRMLKAVSVLGVSVAKKQAGGKEHALMSRRSSEKSSLYSCVKEGSMTALAIMQSPTWWKLLGHGVRNSGLPGQDESSG